MNLVLGLRRGYIYSWVNKGGRGGGGRVKRAICWDYIGIWTRGFHVHGYQGLLKTGQQSNKATKQWGRVICVALWGTFFREFFKGNSSYSKFVCKSDIAN